MSIKALKWCVKQKCRTPTAKLILFLLANYADKQHSCYPSEKHIAEVAGVSDRQVRTHLRDLEASGLIQVRKRSGTSNRYVLRCGSELPEGVEVGFRRGRKQASAYTKDIQNINSGGRKNRRGLMNELAG